MVARGQHAGPEDWDAIGCRIAMLDGVTRELLSRARRATGNAGELARQVSDAGLRSAPLAPGIALGVAEPATAGLPENDIESLRRRLARRSHLTEAHGFLAGRAEVPNREARQAIEARTAQSRWRDVAELLRGWDEPGAATPS